MYYGFPEKREEMHDYLKDILHGREPSDSLIRENLLKLDIVGGETPSNRIVKSIRDKVSDKLEGEGYNVYLLSKHCRPFIKEAQGIINEDVVFEVPLFPVYSKFIFDGYFEHLEAHMRGRKLIRITDIGFESGMTDFYKKRIGEGRDSVLTFSAHSIPLEGYDPYPESVHKLSSVIGEDMKYIIIYHSQGPFHPNWLTPYPEYSISYAKENGFRKIKVVPIGFIYDHLEVLYDLDYKLRKDAREEGIEYERLPLPNDSDVVIDSIVNLIKK